MDQSTLSNKVTEFAAAHPNAVVCAMYHKSWRNTDKLTHLYYVIKDGQPARLPAHKTIDAHLPRYTLDIERGAAWRDFTGQDVYRRLVGVAHINESYLTDRQFEYVLDKCRSAALQLNRYFKNQRLAALRIRRLASPGSPALASRPGDA